MKTSLDMVAGTTSKRSTKKVKRSSLAVGDLFMGAKDRVYMHTGCRSCPPTERCVEFTVGGHKHTHEIYKKLGALPNGKDIIGYQSITVKGTVSPGEDGTNFTTNGNRMVTLVGRGKIKLDL